MNGNNKLTQEEKKISSDLSSGKYRSIDQKKQNDYAKNATRAIERQNKQERVNIRLASKDLEQLKKRAEEEGIPYQTLLSSVIHKYLAGRFVDIRDAQALKELLEEDK